MKYILSILLGLALYPAIADVTELIDSKYQTKLWIAVGIPSYGLTLGLSGRCNDVMRPVELLTHSTLAAIPLINGSRNSWKNNV